MWPSWWPLRMLPYLALRPKIWPKYAQKFGHINGKFWARCCSLDMIHMPWHKCPKKYQVFGHDLGTICMFGHILGIFWAHRVGWTYFGHIFDTFGPIVSKMCLYLHCAPAPYFLASSLSLSTHWHQSGKFYFPPNEIVKIYIDTWYSLQNFA